ncbi:MAG: cold shock domain-containing protein [Acidimicrobiia bacterium]|nr:cold shock domain-containing protein [Acidimicrobiia bacterium]
MAEATSGEATVDKKRAGPGDHEGRVVAFDAHRGLGVVEDRDGTRYDFHCTRIADGGRSVAVGAEVRYQVVPGALGRWEADALSDLVTG